MDRYFESYQFAPEEMTIGPEYQTEEQLFIVNGLSGLDGRKSAVRIASTTLNEDETITIEAKSLGLDDGLGTGYRDILVIQPRESGFHFVSYQIVPPA